MPGGIRGGLSFRTRRMGRLTGPGEAVEVTAAYRPRGRLVGSVGWEAPSLGHEKGSRTKRILAPVPMELASWRPSLETCNLVRASGSEGQAFPGPEACLSPNLDTPCERLLGVTQTLPLVGLGSTSGRGPPQGAVSAGTCPGDHSLVQRGATAVPETVGVLSCSQAGQPCRSGTA